jgi:hypothetical protein
MEKLNILGQKYGKLLVISEEETIGSQSRWLCRCDCGTEIITCGSYLKSGNTKSCGCSRKNSQITNLNGKKIGKYTVISFDKTIKFKNRNDRNYWTCQCECGTIKSVTHRTLMKRNGVQNCGCVTKANLIERSTKLDAGFNKVYRNYKSRSISYSIEFDLSVDEFFGLTQLNCFYCGVLPSKVSTSWSAKIAPFVYNGIDRIDSKLGYKISNCVPCCTKCNYAKGSMSQDEFKKWINLVYEHAFKMSV